METETMKLLGGTSHLDSGEKDETSLIEETWRETNRLLTKSKSSIKKTNGPKNGTSCTSRTRGILFAILSAFSFALQVTCVANVTTVSVVETYCFQTLAMTIGSALWIVVKKKEFFRADQCQFVLWLAYFAGGVSGILFLIAAINMNYSDATAVYFSSPIFIGILAWIILREPCGISQTVSTFLMLVGMVMIIRPSFLVDLFPNGCPEVNTTVDLVDAARIAIFNQSQLPGPTDVTTYNQSELLGQNLIYQSAFGNDTQTGNQTNWWEAMLLPHSMTRPYACIILVGATFLIALASVLFRKYTHVHPSVLTFHYSVTGLVISVALNSLVRGWSFPPDAVAWGLISGSAVASVFAYGFNMVALHYETALVVGLMKTTEVVFAFLFELLVNGRYPSYWSIIGGFLIIGVAIVHGLFGNRNQGASKIPNRNQGASKISKKRGDYLEI